MNSLLALPLALAACATATTSGSEAGSDGGPDVSGRPDAQLGDDTDARPRPDAAPTPDAAPGSALLTQSTSNEIVDLNSVACWDDLFGVTFENHYYRRFDLAAEGLPGGLAIDRVSFGIEVADAQEVELVLHTVTGALELANLTELVRVPVSLPAIASPADGGGQVIDVDLVTSAPAGSSLVVELVAPDNFAQLFIGTNTAGESGPTYIQASDCDIAQPTPVADLAASPMHWVLTVSGQPL